MNRPTIGILAGMGPRSTGPFLDMVLSECERQYGARHDADFPKMMVCSLPVPFFHDRAIDHDVMERALRAGLRDLEGAGADVLAIACNTAHVYWQGLASSVDRPLLDMVALAVADVPAAPRRVALVAARPTVESGIYQRPLQSRGHRVVDPGWQDDVDRLIGATRGARDTSAIAAAWQHLAARAQAEGAETLLVACLDLSAIRGHLTTNLQVVDAGQCLARELVARWRTWPADESRGPYRISTRPDAMDTAAIWASLTRSYWSEGISHDTVARAVRASLCFGVFAGDQQVGFARVVTDRTTYAYLCDVYVVEEHQGKGLGKWLVETVVSHPELRNVRRFGLVTRDAHGLYAQHGFTPLSSPDRFMEILRPDVYRRT